MIGKVVTTLAVIWLAATLAFFALHILPGDAIQGELLGSGASADEIAQRRAALGLDAPVLVQYENYLLGLLRGDLGVSLLNGQPVTEVIGEQLAPTVALAVTALLVATILGLGLGTLAALDIYGSRSARLVLDVALSAPIYWTGTLAIYIFAVRLNWLPSSGSTNLVLPAGVLGFSAAGGIGQVVRANVRETLAFDFVRTARAKGLSEARVIARHVLRASLLPAVTVIALQAGFLLGGVVITESLFIRPGIGRVLLNATLKQDYPVVQGIVVLGAVVYTLLNATADVAYRLLDPRV
ncbi:MAG TPA: ABC transporter permease [Phototrophicaceae bacterium]|nr:ABC transporter permease [Phototrophicaceae bacterium]